MWRGGEEGGGVKYMSYMLVHDAIRIIEQLRP